MVTAGCATSANFNPEVQRMDVSEAVLRHIFQNYGGGDRRPVAFCIGVRERFPGPVIDAPQELILRLGDVRPAVKPRSGCSLAEQVLDTASGRAAVSFHVGPIECPAPNRCTAIGAYTEASLSGSASEYELERRGNGWVVVSQELRAVS
jgi:hypothetical protein